MPPLNEFIETTALKNNTNNHSNKTTEILKNINVPYPIKLLTLGNNLKNRATTESDADVILADLDIDALNNSLSDIGGLQILFKNKELVLIANGKSDTPINLNNETNKLLVLCSNQPIKLLKKVTQQYPELKNKKFAYYINPTENIRFSLAAELGTLAINKKVSALMVAGDNDETILFSASLLQATRMRIYSADFISCPSCGRTVFDLGDTTKAVKQKTEHLKGIKIAIMGCVVNGPGEMADADYGYVGAGPNKIHLYRGQNLIKSNVKQELAVNELINIIKEDGNWIEAS